MIKQIEWGLAALVGAVFVFLMRDLLMPLAAGVLTPGVPKVRGRWESSNKVVGPVGSGFKTSEIVIVRQLGTFIWGWTESGVSKTIVSIGHGNRFRGRFDGQVFRVIFRARNRKVSFLGMMQGYIYGNEKKAKALFMSQHENKEIIVVEADMTKEE